MALIASAITSEPYSGTRSRATIWVTFRAWVRYAVRLGSESPAQIDRSGPPGQHEHDRDEADQRRDEHGADRREATYRPVLVLLPDEDRQHLVARRVQQERTREFPNRDDEDVDPARHQARRHQGKDHLAQRAHQRRPADLRGLVEFDADL